MSRRTSSGSRSGFAMVQWSVIDDMRLDRSDLAVYLALKRFADARGGCWPSISEIARKARMSRSQCFNSIARLASFGYIKKRTVPGRSNFYELVDHGSLYRSYLQAEPVDRAEPRADEAPTAEDYAAGGLVDGDCAVGGGGVSFEESAGNDVLVSGALSDAAVASGEMSMATKGAISLKEANENDTTFPLKAKVPTVPRTAEETTSFKGNASAPMSRAVNATGDAVMADMTEVESATSGGEKPVVIANPLDDSSGDAFALIEAAESAATDVQAKLSSTTSLDEDAKASPEAAMAVGHAGRRGGGAIEREAFCATPADAETAECRAGRGEISLKADAPSDADLASDPAANHLTPGTAGQADAGAIETSNAADDDAAMSQDEAAVAGHPVLATDHAEAGSPDEAPSGSPCGAASPDELAADVAGGSASLSVRDRLPLEAPSDSPDALDAGCWRFGADDILCDRGEGAAVAAYDPAEGSDAMAERPFPMSLRVALSLALNPSEASDAALSHGMSSADGADDTMGEDDLECREQASSAGMSEEDDAWEAACPGWDSLEDASLSYEDALFDGIDDFSDEGRCPFDDEPYPGDGGICPSDLPVHPADGGVLLLDGYPTDEGVYPVDGASCPEDLPVHPMDRGVHLLDGCLHPTDDVCPEDLPVHPMDRGCPPTGQGCPPIGRGCPPIGHEVYTLSRTNKNNHEPDAGPGGATQVRAPGWIEGLPESVKDARVMEACDELSDLGGARRFKTDGEEPSHASSAPADPVSALCAPRGVRGEACPVTSDTEGVGSPEYRGTPPFVENAPRGDGATGTERNFPVDEAEGRPGALSVRGDSPVTERDAEAIEIVKAKAAPSAGDNTSVEAMKAAGDETAEAMVASNPAVADEPVGAANRLTPGTASPADAGAIETSNAADDDAAMSQDEAAVAGHPVLVAGHAEAGSSKMPFGIPCGAASFDDAAERVVTGVQAQPSSTTGAGDRTQPTSEAAMAVGHGVSQCEGSPENPTASAHAGGQGTLSLDESADSAGRKGASLVMEAEGNAVFGKAHAAMSAKGKASAKAAKAATPAGHSEGTPCDPSGQQQLTLPGSETSSEQVRGAQDRLSRRSTMTAADRALSGQATVPARHSPLSTQDAFFTQKSATPEATPGKKSDVRAPRSTRRPSRLKLPLQDDFEAWYSLYPVHKNKWEANKEYLAQRASGVEAKLLLDARDELIRRCREDGRAKRYIPRADTFLRGKWRSYLPEAVATLERTFDEFWEMWPGLQEGRDGARREWARRFRALSDPDDRNRALALIAEQVAQLSDRVDSGTDPRYLPRAKNFIRDADFGTRLE